jgi:multiple sugar transport system substrate-binding protein
MIARKHLFWLACMLILATGITSCDGVGRVDPRGQEVTFWYQHTGDREQVLQSMIEDFNATNEWGITVKGEFAGDYDAINDKIVDGCSTGQVPDISVAYQNQAAVYAASDCVVELTSYINSRRWGFSEEELDDFFPFVFFGDYLPQLDGSYGFPTQRSMEVLYYNEDWLHDLNYDHPPRTWEEFEVMACAASDRDSDIYADMLFNQGGALTNPDQTGYTFGDEAGLKVLTLLHNLFEKGCLIVESDTHEDRVEFSEGRTLFTISSTSGLPEYLRMVSEGAGFNWSISTLPTVLDSPRVNVYGASLSIFRTTDEVQLAAWLFIKWLTEPEQTAHWARSSNYFPVRKSAAESLEGYFAENPQYEKAFGLLDYDIVIEPGIKSYDSCRASISEMFEAAALGGDPGSVLGHAQDECNDLLQEFSEK